MFIAPTQWPAPCWLVSSLKFGRTRHQNRRGHGFKSRTDLNFFGPYFLYRSSDVHYCEDRFHMHSYICFLIGPLSSIFFLGGGLVGSRLTALIFLSRFKPFNFYDRKVKGPPLLPLPDEFHLMNYVFNSVITFAATFSLGRTKSHLVTSAHRTNRKLERLSYAAF